MKRTIAVLLVIISIMTCLTGCAKDRKLYKKAKLKNYVEIEGYKGIEVDTTTESFKKIYDKFASGEPVTVYGKELLDENGYIGFLYLSDLFGANAVEEKED